MSVDTLLQENEIQQWDKCYQFVFKHEAGFQNRTDDPGNWTGGKIGVGELVGTNYGISAASYPNLDIPNIKAEEAHEIYLRDYYLPAGCNKMPYPLALSIFDSAVNQGLRWTQLELQRILGVVVDGVIGPKTLQAISLCYGKSIVRMFLVKRLMRYSSIENRAWKENWFERMVDVTSEVMDKDLYK